MLTGATKGRWWLPDTPEHTVTGTLYTDWEQRPRLEVIGTLDASSTMALAGSMLGHSVVHRRVFGSSTALKPITLVGVEQRVRNMHLEDPGGAVIEYQATSAYIGEHIAGPEAKYSRMRLRLGRLLDWLEPPRMSRAFEPRLSHQAPIHHAWRPWDDVVVLDLGDASLQIQVIAAEFGDGVTQAGIRQRGSFVVTAATPLTPDEWFRLWIKPLRDLITFATGIPSDIVHVGFQATSAEDAGVEWIWKRSGPGPDGGERALVPAEMLLTLLDLGDDAARAIGRWVDLAREAEDIVNLFLGPRYAGRMYEENRFLNLVQAMEALHRREHGERQSQTSEVQARVERVVAAAPADDQEWLAERLDYATRISIRERLKDIVAKHRWLVGEALPKRSFVHDVVQARHLHTHWDAETSRGAPRGFALWPLNEGMNVLLECMVLELLGIEVARREELVRRGSRSFHAMKVNPELVEPR